MDGDRLSFDVAYSYTYRGQGTGLIGKPKKSEIMTVTFTEGPF